MASLTLSVGPITETVSMPDAAAVELLTAYVATLELPGTPTNQEKAHAVLISLAQHMRHQAQRGVDTEENTEARTRAAARIAALQDWSE